MTENFQITAGDRNEGGAAAPVDTEVDTEFDVASSGGPRLFADLAAAIDQTPGVAGRESSVSDFVRSLWTPRSGKRREKQTDGPVRSEGLAVHQGGREVSVTVALRVTRELPALDVARSVRLRVDEVITSHALKPGMHSINVWDLD